MQQVMKPHNARVNKIDYSPDGLSLATCGEDGIVFVLSTPTESPTAAYVPTGFVETPREAPIQGVCWRSDSKALLYTYGCTAVEIDCAEPLTSISADSFVMTPPMREFVYKDRPVMKSQEEQEEEDAAAAAGEEKKEEVIIVPPTIAAATYCGSHEMENFLITFTHEKAGTIYECRFGEEYSRGLYMQGTAHVAGPLAYGNPVANSMRTSNSGKFVLNSYSDGSVTVRPSEQCGYFSKQQLHSASSGGAADAALSFDDEFLITAGRDGIVGIVRLNPTEVKKQADKAAEERKVQDEAEAALKKLTEAVDSGEGSSAPPEGLDEIASSAKDAAKVAAAAEIVKQADEAAKALEDITEAEAYSIQDEKLRKEEDARKLKAEQKKDGVRAVIKEMQKEFEDLVKKNEALPLEQQLTIPELVVDPEYAAILTQKGTDMVKEVELECLHASEKSSVRLQKLQNEFLDVLDHELVYVRGLKNNLKVASIPTSKFTKELQTLLDHVHTIMASEAASATRGKDAAGGARGLRSTLAINKKGKKTAVDLNADSEYGANGEKKSAFEIRKIQRVKRTKNLAELEEKKPAEDADDPRDVKAIEDASKFLGDYKIKTSEDYEVPEDQQVNAEKKRRQMILLEESIRNIKVKFNKRLIDVRDSKGQVVLAIAAFNARIRAIDEQLGDMTSSLFAPELDPREYPGDRSFFLPEDNVKFLASVATSDNVESANAPSVSVSSLAVNAPKRTQVKNATAGIAPECMKLCRTLPILRAMYDPETDGDLPKVADEAALSQVERNEIDENRMRLRHERSSLVDKIASDVKDIDSKVAGLRRDRLIFSVELKAAELRLLTLFKELMLLSSFEAKDRLLTNKLEKCQRDKGEVVANISDCLSRLQTNSGQLEVWVEKDQAIMDEFLKVVPEKNAFHAQLLKIFKRKIKRAKKKSTEDEDGDEDEDDSGDDYEDDDEEDDEVDDSCPPGCDTHLYESIIELREKRLDQEEVLADFQKELDDLKKANERHIARERQIDKDLNSTEVEIKKFQTEKQVHINELLTCCPLKIGQIRLWKEEEDNEGNVMDVSDNPTMLRDSVTIKDCVVFAEASLDKVRGRIGELKEEILSDKASFGGLHKEKRALEKDKVLKEKEIEKQHVRCNELQMLKFGQLINIGELDKISVNSEEIELKKKTEALEVVNMGQIHTVHRKERKLKEKLLDVTKVNTGKLNKIAEMNGRQFFLEKELNGNKGGMQVADDGPTLRQETEERNRLVSLVKLQAKEVDALKAEINLLRRKGGHIYAPPPPPELLGDMEGGGITALDMSLADGEMAMDVTGGQGIGERPGGVEVAPNAGLGEGLGATE